MNKKVLWLSIILFAWILVAACGLTSDMSTVRDMGKDFMTALEEGDHTTSYAMLSPELKQEIGNLDAWAAFAGPRAFWDWSFSSTEVENDMAQMDGEASFTDGDYDIRLVFTKYGDDWKITGINFWIQE